MSLIIVPKALRDPLGEEGAAALVEIINAAAVTQEKNTAENIGERLEKRLAETKADLQKEIAETKADLQKEIAETKADLRREIAETKTSLIKWMFVFWLAQFGGLGGLIIWMIVRLAG